LATMSHVRMGGRPTGNDWVRQLLTQGYCIIPGLLPELKLEALYNDLLPHFLTAPFCVGDSYDKRSKRFGGLLGLSQHAAAVVLHPLILEIAQSILDPHCDRFHLNFTQAFEIWPGRCEQTPRRTRDLWHGLQVEIECVVTAIWPFQPHRAENGAAFIWPESHSTPAGNFAGRLQPVTVQMDPGAVLLFLGSTLRGAKSNSSNVPCAGMNVSYSVGWLTPLENHWLAYTPQISQTFSTELAGLIGYPQRRPKRGNDAGAPAQALLPNDIPGYHRTDEGLYPALDLAGGGLDPLAIGKKVSKSIVARLRVAYELTNSEAEVGQLLLAGAHARQISRLRAVSVETVRSQIKHVYSKAAVKSHSEFILHNRSLLLPLFGVGTRDAHRDDMPVSRIRDERA
jgi:DNA-binding CsgD family transcriptional regulator